PYPPRHHVPHDRIGGLCHQCGIAFPHASGTVPLATRVSFPALVVADVVMHARSVGVSPRLVILASPGRIVWCKTSPRPVRSAPPSPDRNLALGISKIWRVVANVRVKVCTATSKLFRIFTQEPASVLVIVARPVIPTVARTRRVGQP